MQARAHKEEEPPTMWVSLPPLPGEIMRPVCTIFRTHWTHAWRETQVAYFAVTSHRLTVISDTSRFNMAADDALVALKAHVARVDYRKPLRTLEDVQSYLDSCYPSLERSVIKDDDDSFFVTLIR